MRGLRIAGALTLLLFVSFALVHVGHGELDPETELSTAEQVRRFENAGLDHTVAERFGCWLLGHSQSGCEWWPHGNGILRADLGRSLKHQIPVAQLLKDRLLHTIGLMVPVWAVSVLASLVLGIFALSYGWAYLLVRIASAIGPSLPHHWWAMMAVVLVSYFSSSIAIGYGLAFAATSAFFVIRWLPWVEAHLRASQSSPFVEGLRSRGIPEGPIRLHVVRHAMLPLATLYGQWLPLCFVGSLVVEQVFVIPGVGALFIESVLTRDYPLAGVLFGLYSFVSLLSLELVHQLSRWFPEGSD